MSKESFIEDAYLNTNFGGPEKIYTYLKKNYHDIKITKEEIKTFLNKQEQEQILKKQKPPKALGHIVASFPFEIVQMDIFDFSKYASDNHNYKYMMAFVDVFTRFAVIYPMKTKNIDDTTSALQAFINLTPPVIIMSDNDSSFLGDKFQDVLDEHNIILEPNVKGDHFALGIIDNFAKRIRDFFSKINLKYKINKYNWVDNMNQFISKYNDSPHMALDGLSPMDAVDPKNYAKIFEINARKGLKNKTVSDLQPGDKVRIKIAGMFSKGSEPQYSDKVYIVETVRGSTIHLYGGEIKKRYNLLKVPKETESSTKNIMKVAAEKAKVIKEVKKIDPKEENITREKRSTAGKFKSEKFSDTDLSLIKSKPKQL
jgi:hypothetical protein